MTTRERPGGRLPVLDGIRALAALYVLVFHEFDITVPQMGERLAWPMRAVRNVFAFGHLAVCVFIVLSGFSLMIPMARAGSWQLKGGLKGYLRRRGRRVLPAYYAALAVSLVVMVGHDHVGLLSPGSLVSHLLLVQNWGRGWAVNINGPMWSVATEWQIYFLMPLVLIPLWRRYGATLTIVVAFVLPSLVFFVIPAQYNMSWAAPWFLGSFALGMWGAEIAFSPSGAHRFREAPWSLIAVIAALGVLAMVASGNAELPGPLMDGLVSIGALSWIMASVLSSASDEQSNRFIRVLGSRPLVFVAAFSYSLYLLQQPILKVMENAVGRLPLSYDNVLLVQLLLGTPVVLAAAWLFAEFCERPFSGGGVLLPSIRRALKPTSVARAGKEAGVHLSSPEAPSRILTGLPGVE